jgi:hypothetical protein
MRTWITVALCVITTACGGSAKRSTENPSNTGSTQGVERFWDVLESKGARWELNDAVGEGGDKLIVTVASVESKGDHVIVELKWTHIYEGGESESNGPQRLAISPRGIWLIDGMEDAELAAALRAPAVFAEPPVEIDDMTREDGKYVRVDTRGDEKVVCLGEGPAPGAGECEDVCYAEMCVAEKSGIVGVEGLWAPNYGMYEQDGFGAAPPGAGE